MSQTTACIAGDTSEKIFSMNRKAAKRIVLGQLASYLRREVILDGVADERDVATFEVAQKELASEFLRRAGGEQIPERFDKFNC